MAQTDVPADDSTYAARSASIDPAAGQLAWRQRIQRALRRYLHLTVMTSFVPSASEYDKASEYGGIPPSEAQGTVVTNETSQAESIGALTLGVDEGIITEPELYTCICWSRLPGRSLVEALLTMPAGFDAMVAFFADRFEANAVTFCANALALVKEDMVSKAEAKASDDAYEKEIKSGIAVIDRLPGDGAPPTWQQRLHTWSYALQHAEQERQRLHSNRALRDSKQIATVHNLGFYLWLVRTARERILAGDFLEWKTKMVRQMDKRL